jgi:cytochrome c peroxidase
MVTRIQFAHKELPSPRNGIEWEEEMVRPLAIIFAILLTPAPINSLTPQDNLLYRARRIFSPLPEIMNSNENPVTPEKVTLGKTLFHETRISADNTVSCAKCHIPGMYGTDGLPKSTGNRCKPNPRNAPSVFNAAGHISQHWIGNRTSVEDQAKQALIGPASFGLPSYEEGERILKGIEGYCYLFAKAFPNEVEPVTIENFAKAIGAFERTLVTPSPFDEFLRGDEDALGEEQKRGLKAFMDLGCSNCHNGTYVGGGMYQKFGLTKPYWEVTGSNEIDEGRYAVTKNEADKYVFKVPSLRNVAKTPPYFHDGSVERLDDAVRIMGKLQLGKTLTDEQVREIVAFLNALTGKVPKDALTLPILPQK